MKRTILFALMIPLLLTGCGARRDAENWKAFAETVETAERISFHAEITRDGRKILTLEITDWVME